MADPRRRPNDRSQGLSPLQPGMPLLLIFTLWALLQFWPRFSLAADQRDTYLFATDVWPPFRIDHAEATPANPFTGIDIDLLNAISRQTGLKFSVVKAPWARVLEQLEHAQSDIILGIAHTPERARYLIYSEIPYYSVTPVFYTTKGTGKKIQQYADLMQYEIGYVRGSAYFEPFNSDDRLRKVEVAQELQLIQMLGSKRLPVIIGTNPQLRYDICQQGLNTIVEQTTYQPTKKTDLFLAVAKDSPLAEHMTEINQTLHQLVQSGEIDRIIKKYLPE